jgi:hypothetical protein
MKYSWKIYNFHKDYIQGITNLTHFWKSRVQQSLSTAPFIRYVESKWCIADRDHSQSPQAPQSLLGQPAVKMCCPELSVTFGQPGVRLCCPELPGTFWTARNEDVLPSAPSYFLIFEQPTRSEKVLSWDPSHVLDSQERGCVVQNSQSLFGQPGLRMCCSELPVTFWSASSEDVLSRAPSHFLDSQEWGCVVQSSQSLFGQSGVRMCCPELPVTFWTARSEDVLSRTPSHFLIFGQLGVRRYCPELPVTFWAARSEEVLSRAPNKFFDSQEWWCFALSPFPVTV